MRFKGRFAILPVFIGLLLAGCLETSRPTPTGEGGIRGVNAISTAPDLTFRIEEASLGKVAYKDTTPTQTFDDFNYDFNFDVQPPGATAARRVATKSLKVVADTDYVFLLTGTLDTPSVVVWDAPERQWEGSETVLEVSAGHVAPSLGQVDVYLEPSGTAPAAGQARGTLAFGDRLPAFDVEAGDYRFFVTAHDDPSAVIFKSNLQSLAAMTTMLFTIQDADPSVTSSISVRRVDQTGSSAELADLNSPPERRYFHAAVGTANIDVAVNQDFSALLVSNLAPGQLSPYVPLPSGESTYTYTEAGNQGVVLLEEDEVIPSNARTTAFVMGKPGDVDVVSFIDDERSIASLAKLRISLLSSNFDTVDLYLLKAGGNIADAGANFPGFATKVTTGYLKLAADSYEFTVTKAGEKTVIGGPFALDVANGDVTNLALKDTVDPNVIDIVRYDNP